MGHLLSLGHTRIGLLLGPADHVPSNRKLDAARLVAARERHPAAREPRRALAVLAGGRPGRRRPGCCATGVTGIVCASDPMALGAIRAVRRLGKSVPADVSVVGYDDSALMNCTEPPLTTVRQPIEPMGRMVIELLVGQMAGGSGAPSTSCASSRSWSSAVPRGLCAPPDGLAMRGHRAIVRGFLSSSCIVLSGLLRCGPDPATLPLRGDAGRLTGTRIRDPDRPRRRGAPRTVASLPLSSRPRPTTPTWWRDAVIYEVYPRSFADADGDGTGDLAGVRSRLGYLRDLGVDAIWFTPWYVSPLADGGYDVADYRAIDPVFGTLEEAEGLIAEALAMGIRTIVDVVPNHVSDQHRWFQAALAAGPGSPERARFWFRPGRGPDGDEMPTGVALQLLGHHLDAHHGRRRHARRVVPAPVLGRSSRTSTGTTRTCAGSTRTSSASGSTGAPPGCASTPPRCWSRTPSLPEEPSHPPSRPRVSTPTPTATSSTTSIAAGAPSPTRYPGTRILVGEVWLPDVARFALYLRPDELHTAFNFDFMAQPWDAGCAAGVHRPDARGARAHRRAGRRGCCPTTTSPGP